MENSISLGLQVTSPAVFLYFLRAKTLPKHTSRQRPNPKPTAKLSLLSVDNVTVVGSVGEALGENDGLPVGEREGANVVDALGATVGTFKYVNAVFNFYLLNLLDALV